MKATAFLEAVAQNLFHALRTTSKNPAFAGAVILTLALAIGGNTAMFSVIHAVLLKPLEYRDPEQLVRMSGGATPIRFEEMKASAHSFSGIGAFSEQESVALAGSAGPEVLTGARISANFLQILSVNPLLGRSFLPEEDKPGGAAAAMISAGLWQRRFGGDFSVIGKTVALEAKPYTIVGVLPAHFQFPSPGVDVWMTRPSEWPLMPAKSRLLSPFLTIFGRMKPGVSLEQANVEAAVLRHQYALAHPAMLDARPKASPGKAAPELVRLKEQLVASVRTMLWMLFGAVCFVLLIACANVANLLLARAAFRERELAIRSALGAARLRLIGQLLTESLVLSCASGVLGVLLAVWIVRAIPSMLAFHLPRALEIHLDPAVLGFAAALSIGTGLLFGLAPSLSASRPDLMSVLRSRGEAAANEGIRRRMPAWLNLRGLLVIVQVALSVMLLTGASLLLESVVHLGRADVGFNPANLLTVRVSLPSSRYDTDGKKALFFEELVRRMRSSPGIHSATAAMFLPMTGFVGSPVQDADKPPLQLNERLIATLLVVAPDYFRTLEIPLRRGRDFTERDADGAPRMAIIDESCARHFWPSYPGGQNPVGQRLFIGGVNAQPVEIAGIVANVHQNLENSAWPETVYVSLAQNPQPSAMLALRTTGEPLRLTKAVREQVLALDRDQPISEVRTMEELVDEQKGERRLTVTLLSSFAGGALLLAVIGIYGVVAYSVAQRTKEIGIRRALGARPGNVLRLVVGQGLGFALAGVGLGLAGAFAVTRVLKHLLFQVSATDPVTFLGVGLLFVAVVLAASFIPASRATGIDPMKALQIE